MIAIIQRFWSLAAVAFAISASAAQLAAHYHASQGMTIPARGAAGAIAQQAWPVAKWHSSRSDHWLIVGVASALLAAACRARASTAGKPAPHAALTILLIAYALLAMLVV